MVTVDKLKIIFGVKDDRDLAVILGRSPQAVSNWKTSGIPAAIERKARELMDERGIVAEQETPYRSEQKKPGSAIVSAILGIIENMTPEEQAAELKRLTDQLIASQLIEK